MDIAASGVPNKTGRPTPSGGSGTDGRLSTPVLIVRSAVLSGSGSDKDTSIATAGFLIGSCLTAIGHTAIDNESPSSGLGVPAGPGT